MSIDLEAMDELNERMSYLVENMEQHIMDMRYEESYVEASNDLFRLFHSIKALAAYLKITPILKTAHAIEEILSIIRFKKPPILPEILDWLLMLNDHIKEWESKIENHDYDLEEIDRYTLDMVKTAVILSKKPEEILLDTDLLIISSNEMLISKIKKTLKGKLSTIYTVSSEKEFQDIVRSGKIGILIFDPQIDTHAKVEIAKCLKKTYPLIPIVLLLSKKLNDEEKLLFKETNIQKVAPVTILQNDLIETLKSIALKYCQSKKIKLLLAPTIKRIESLKPLPGIMSDIREFEKNEKASLRDLSSIITQDPLVSAKILKMMNAPFFGTKNEVSSIHQAITLLGKEGVISLAIQSHLNDDVEFDLSPYGIDLEKFFKVSKNRMKLAMKWYSKISLENIGLVTTAALLGNLGQVLIAEAILKEKKKKEFLSMLLETNPAATEIEFLYTTTEDTTADILDHWGLNKDMINAIRYANDLGNAPDEIKVFATILHVIFSTITITQPYADPKTIDDMAEFLSELNFNPDHYVNAIKRL